MSQTEKELSYKAFLNREYGFRHSPFEKEFEFYECVKKGDVDGVERVMTPLGGSGAGILSNDPLRNLRYHFIEKQITGEYPELAADYLEYVTDMVYNELYAE